MPIITLTTDFGTRDGYAAAMKAAIAARTTEATRVFEVTHDVPRGDVAHAAWLAATTCTRFPAETIHVIAVDPTPAARAVVVRAGDQYFIGADNGMFAYLEVQWARAIESRLLREAEPSATFRGRDVFAPCAGVLTKLADDELIGREVALVGVLPWGDRPEGAGRVVHVDVFGNAITDLPRAEIAGAIDVGGRRLAVVRAYDDVPSGEPVAYVGDHGTIEIAVRDGRADRVLGIARGTRVVPVADGGAYR